MRRTAGVRRTLMRRIRVVRRLAKKWRKLFFFAILCGIYSFCSAREYYVDSSGNTGGDGSMQRPWRSLDSLFNLVFQPGDKILFARGSRFVGGVVVRQSGTETAPIFISSYGSGKLPKF